MSPPWLRRSTLGAALLAALATGCVPQGLAFRTDDRVTIIRPADRSTVSLPVTLDWDVRDFSITDSGPRQGDRAGYFAVFVDTAPVPPGKPLSWVARKDTSCRAADGCPDREYLTARGIYPTTQTELTLDQVPRTTSRNDRRERHRAVIILLDPTGRRIGESAYEVEFDLKRSRTS